MQASDVKKISLFTLVATIYMLLGFFKFGGLMAYIMPSICWSFLALITLYLCGLEKIRLWFNKPLTIMASLIAASQIVLLVFTAFFAGFGRSPYQSTPIAIVINVVYFLSTLLGLEFSRAYLIKSCPRRRIFMGIILITLFYTLVSLPPTRFTAPGTAAEIAKFLCLEFIPTLAGSLLATYLALLGGPTASIAYLGTLEAFHWLSPILPNPAWPIKALINTLVPAMGFLTMDKTVNPSTLVQLGIISRPEATGRIRRAKKSSPLTWTTVAVVTLILVWGSSGLFGIRPSIIASGSMRPTLDVGDIAITIQTRPEAIKVGDIIQYRKQGEPESIIHRVIEVYKSGSTTYIVTKGDANNASDDPIIPTNTVSKLILTIPKLGWVSIYLKAFAADACAFFTNNPAIAYAVLTIAPTVSILGIHRYRKQSLRRRLKREHAPNVLPSRRKWMLLYRKKEANVDWRVSFRGIFDMLVRLDTRKLKFGIGNPYGKSVVLEIEPHRRRVSMTLYPYKKVFMLRI